MTALAPESLERTEDADAPLLDVRDLRTYFKTDDGIVRAVDGVSFCVRPGQTLGVVGESGSGKSVTMMSILNLNPKPGRLRVAPGSPPGGQMEAFLRGTKKHTSVSTGQALFRGENLLEASKRRLRALRGSEISMIFQDPMTSLNPVLSIGNQLVEAIMLHRDVTSKQARELAIAGLQEVGIPRPEERVDSYSFELSGGLRQRVMIALALAAEPRILIADEPTTALDVTTQAQILDLIHRLQQERGLAVILITHDMGVIAEMTDEVVVMYLGHDVERGPVDAIFHDPKHPYTRSLLRSIPSVTATPRARLKTITGSIPHPYARPKGCPFHPRCPDWIKGTCETAFPATTSAGPRQEVSCFLYTGAVAERAA